MRGDSTVFRRQLLEWFDAHKRDLPWRQEPGLYKTVVSEFMLQQTQVDTVLPYFDRWMKALPGFRELALADESTVMKLWEGLGYYSRARNLHKLGKSIISDGIPECVEDWLQRPGVGPYTAAAISSIAQSVPEPVIDGNVIRVLARLSNDATPVPSSTVARRHFLSIARDLIDPHRPGDYNEALMELGATVCRKARPACLLCPVREHCNGRIAGREADLPVIPRKSATRRMVHRAYAIHEGKILLHFHPETARRLAGLAELPELKDIPAGEPVLVRSRGISSERITESIYPLKKGDPAWEECRKLPTSKWVSLDDLDAVTLSAPHRRWISELLAGDGRKS